MLAQIITENGQKKIKPLTADAGAGNPVGTIIPMYKKSSPSGYLYCDGSTFDQTQYPLLYAYLGTNVLPDYREFALVGAEENTTDVYNASTNPNGTIHDHDVYTEGQAKDDQLQSHQHRYTNADSAGYDTYKYFNIANGKWSWSTSLISNNDGRTGTVTRGKRKAVYFYIKATSGLSENAQDNVINTLNEERSYSTEEVNTGKKWIDGKPIYRCIIPFQTKQTIGSSTTLTIGAALPTTIPFSNFDNISNFISGAIYRNNRKTIISVSVQYNSTAQIQVSCSDNYGDTDGIILEYTKTTD